MGGLEKFRDKYYSNLDALDVKAETFRNIVTGCIYQIMDNENISKSVLAEKMKISKAAVTTLLSGDRNFTIDKLSEICYHLSCTPQFKIICNRDLEKEHFKARWYLINKSETHYHVKSIKHGIEYDVVHRKASLMHSYSDYINKITEKETIEVAHR